MEFEFMIGKGIVYVWTLNMNSKLSLHAERKYITEAFLKGFETRNGISQIRSANTLSSRNMGF